MTLWPKSKDDFPLFDLTAAEEENSGEFWNPLCDAIEAIQGWSGTDPQGTEATVDARLSHHLDDDGELEEFDSGTVSGIPTQASPVTITFGKTFSTAPYVFVLARVAPGGLNNNDGLICAVQNVTTSQCELVTKTKGGSNPSNSITYAWLAIDGSARTSLA